MPEDPICGMNVDTSSPLKVKKDGQDFYFCSEHCKKKFLDRNKAKNKSQDSFRDPSSQKSLLRMTTPIRFHEPPKSFHLAERLGRSGLY